MIRTLRSKMDVTTSWTMKFRLGTRFVEESCGMEPTLGDRFTPQEIFLNLHNSKYCMIDGGFDIRMSLQLLGSIILKVITLVSKERQ